MTFLVFSFLKLFVFLMFMFFYGMFVFVSLQKHLLLTLLSLEFLVVVLFITLFYFLMFYGYEGYFDLVFLTFSVCEGAMGLGILVSLIRVYGNDNVSCFSLISW